MQTLKNMGRPGYEANYDERSAMELIVLQVCSLKYIIMWNTDFEYAFEICTLR